MEDVESGNMEFLNHYIQEKPSGVDLERLVGIPDEYSILGLVERLQRRQIHVESVLSR